MKVILPVHRERISPVFDWCLKALIVDIQSGDAVRTREIDLSRYSELERISIMEDLGECTLLCGGISLQLEGIISYLGIDVISWISGNASDVLDSYMNGTLFEKKCLMPGTVHYRSKTFSNSVLKLNNI